MPTLGAVAAALVDGERDKLVLATVVSPVLALAWYAGGGAVDEVDEAEAEAEGQL